MNIKTESVVATSADGSFSVEAPELKPQFRKPPTYYFILARFGITPPSSLTLTKLQHSFQSLIMFFLNPFSRQTKSKSGSQLSAGVPVLKPILKESKVSDGHFLNGSGQEVDGVGEMQFMPLTSTGYNRSITGRGRDTTLNKRH